MAKPRTQTKRGSLPPAGSPVYAPTAAAVSIGACQRVAWTDRFAWIYPAGGFPPVRVLRSELPADPNTWNAFKLANVAAGVPYEELPATICPQCKGRAVIGEQHRCAVAPAIGRAQDKRKGGAL